MILILHSLYDFVLKLRYVTIDICLLEIINRVARALEIDEAQIKCRLQRDIGLLEIFIKAACSSCSLFPSSLWLPLPSPAELWKKNKKASRDF